MSGTNANVLVEMPGLTAVGVDIVGLTEVDGLHVQSMPSQEVHRLVAHLGYVGRLTRVGVRQPTHRHVIVACDRFSVEVEVNEVKVTVVVVVLFG